MTLLLNAALDPGFVGVYDESWCWEVLSLGRGAPFVGVTVEHLVPDLQRVETIVVVHGPGSSTGLRIVCAYANGLAMVTGANLRVLSSITLVRTLHAEHPDTIAFRQSSSRVTVARGDHVADAPEAPADAWVYDPAALVIDPIAFDALVGASKPTEVIIPQYWAPPQISGTRPNI